MSISNSDSDSNSDINKISIEESDSNLQSESESESECDYDSCEDLQDDEKELNLSSMDLVNNNRVNELNRHTHKIIICNNLKTFSNIESFSNNNPINKKHVNKLKLSLKENKTKSLDSIFVVVGFKDGSIILIDGHHRMQAIKELYASEELKDDYEFEIHLYELDIDYEPTHKDVLDIFYKVNNTKPYKTVNDNTKKTIIITKKLKETYSELFKNGKKRANFPYVHESTFNQTLTKLLYNVQDIDIEKILNNIHNQNQYFKENARKILKDISRKDYKHKLTKIKESSGYIGIYAMNYDWLKECL